MFQMSANCDTHIWEEGNGEQEADFEKTTLKYKTNRTRKIKKMSHKDPKQSSNKSTH